MTSDIQDIYYHSNIHKRGIVIARVISILKLVGDDKGIAKVSDGITYFNFLWDTTCKDTYS